MIFYSSIKPDPADWNAGQFGLNFNKHSRVDFRWIFKVNEHKLVTFPCFFRCATFILIYIDGLINDLCDFFVRTQPLERVLVFINDFISLILLWKNVVRNGEKVVSGDFHVWAIFIQGLIWTPGVSYLYVGDELFGFSWSASKLLFLLFAFLNFSFN